MKTQVRVPDTSRLSSFDRALGACLVSATLFVFGYTVTHIFLAQPEATSTAQGVVPHQAELWSDFGPIGE